MIFYDNDPRCSSDQKEQVELDESLTVESVEDEYDESDYVRRSEYISMWESCQTVDSLYNMIAWVFIPVLYPDRYSHSQ